MNLSNVLTKPLGALALLPVAPWGDEALTPLPADSEESEVVTYNFPEPVILVGAYPSVIQNSDQEEGMLIPTTNDISVMLQTNKKHYWTNEQKGSALDGNAGAQWNTLAMLGCKERFLWIRMDEATPQMAVTYKWKRFTEGTPRYTDALVGLGFYVLYPNRLSPELKALLLDAPLAPQ
jgi:hypothetical protein